MNKDWRAVGVQRRLQNIWQKVLNKGDDYVEGIYMLCPCVKEPQAEIRASEQNLSDFLRSM